MSQFSFSIISTDGLTPTPDLIFTPGSTLSSEVAGNIAQVIKTSAPDLKGRTEYPGFYCDCSPTNRPVALYTYDSVSSTWVITYKTDWKGKPAFTYLSFFIPFNEWGRCYTCTSEDQEGLVPNRAAGGIYIKPDEIPAKSAFSGYLRTKQSATVTDAIPLALTHCYSDSDGGHGNVSCIGLGSSTDTEFLVPSVSTLTNGTSLIIDPSKKTVSTQIKVLNPGENPPSIGERVTSLEDKVDANSIAIKSINHELTTLKTLVDRITDINSSYYVSR